MMCKLKGKKFSLTKVSGKLLISFENVSKKSVIKDILYMRK